MRHTYVVPLGDQTTCYTTGVVKRCAWLQSFFNFKKNEPKLGPGCTLTSVHHNPKWFLGGIGGYGSFFLSENHCIKWLFASKELACYPSARNGTERFLMQSKRFKYTFPCAAIWIWRVSPMTKLLIEIMISFHLLSMHLIKWFAWSLHLVYTFVHIQISVSLSAHNPLRPVLWDWLKHHCM